METAEKALTKEQEWNIVEALDYADEKLSEAIEAVEKLARELRNNGARQWGRRMESYIIPHLKGWLEDENECASLADIRANLEVD